MHILTGGLLQHKTIENVCVCYTMLLYIKLKYNNRTMHEIYINDDIIILYILQKRQYSLFREDTFRFSISRLNDVSS